MDNANPSNDPVVEPVFRQLEAYNRRDIEAFVPCFAEDVVCHNLTAEAPVIVGREQFRERYAALFAGNPDLHARLASRIVVGNFVIDEERVTGMVRAAGEEVHVAAIYHVVDGIIRSVWFTR